MITKALLIIAAVCLAIGCNENTSQHNYQPIRIKDIRDSTSAYRYRPNEIMVVFKKPPTSKDRRAIKTPLAETGIDTAALTVRKCNSCKDAYIELWQADNIHTMIRAEALGGGTVSDRGKAVGEDGVAYYSLNFENSIPMDSKLRLDTIKYNGKVTEFSGEDKDTIRVAVLDTGIDATRVVNPVFQWTNANEKSNRKDDDSNCYVDDIHGWNFIHDNSNVVDDNINLHGTLVAHYIITEFELSTKNFVQIMSLKTHDVNGEGDLFSSVCAIHYAMNKGANIINASWGFYYYQDKPHPYLDLLVTKTLAKKGILFVTAAGNKDKDVDELAKQAYLAEHGVDFPDELLRDLEYHNFYPACLSGKGKNVITVTTTDGKLVSPTQNFSEKYVDIGVIGDVNDASGMKFKTPFEGEGILISGSSFATAIASGKIGAYVPKSTYVPNLNKDAIHNELETIIPDDRPEAVITREPLMEEQLIKKGRKTYRR